MNTPDIEHHGYVFTGCLASIRLDSNCTWKTLIQDTGWIDIGLIFFGKHTALPGKKNGWKPKKSIKTTCPFHMSKSWNPKEKSCMISPELTERILKFTKKNIGLNGNVWTSSILPRDPGSPPENGSGSIWTIMRRGLNTPNHYLRIWLDA